MELGLRPQQNEPKEAMAKSPRFAYGRLVDISRLEFVLRESRMTSIGLFLFGWSGKHGKTPATSRCCSRT